QFALPRLSNCGIVRKRPGNYTITVPLSAITPRIEEHRIPEAGSAPRVAEFLVELRSDLEPSRFFLNSLNHTFAKARARILVSFESHECPYVAGRGPEGQTQSGRNCRDWTWRRAEPSSGTNAHALHYGIGPIETHTNRDGGRCY